MWTAMASQPRTMFKDRAVDDAEQLSQQLCTLETRRKEQVQ